MKSAIMALLFLIPSLAFSRTPISMVETSCNILNKSKAYRCAVGWMDWGLGASMIIDFVQKPTDEERLHMMNLKEMFFDAGGNTFEFVRPTDTTHHARCHATNDRRNPYYCEAVKIKDSIRALKARERK